MNFLNLGLAQVVSAATGMVSAIILGRALEPDAFGVLGFATAFLSFFGLFVNMGTDVHGMRETARSVDKGARIAAVIFSTRLCLAVLAIVMALTIGRFGGISEIKLTVIGIQAAGLIGVALISDFYFQGAERMGLIAARQIGAALTSVIAVIVLIRTPDDLYVAAAIPVTTNVLSAVVLIWFFRRQSGTAIFIFDAGKAWETLKKSAPFAVTAFMTAIYFNLDLVMLGFMRGNAEIGHYSAAVRIMMAGLILGNLFRTAYLPPLSRAVDDSPEKAALFRRYCRAVFFVAVPVALFGGLYAADIIELLFGHAYAASRHALEILMLAVAANYAVMAYGAPLIAWNKEKTFTKVVTLGAAINLVLNFALIPRFGIEGAAAATLASQITVAVICFVVHGRFVRNSPVVDLLKFAGAAALALGVCRMGFGIDSLASLVGGGPRLMFAIPAFSLTYLACVAIVCNGGIRDIIRS